MRDGFIHEQIERYLGNAPKDEEAREKVRVLLMFMQDVTEQGYSGMQRGGMLVDRREHPDAIPVPANVELDAVQRGGFMLMAWRQVVVGGRSFSFIR